MEAGRLAEVALVACSGAYAQRCRCPRWDPQWCRCPHPHLYPHLYPPICTHMHMHMYPPICTHICTHMHPHAQARTPTQAHAHTCMHAPTHAHAHTDTHTHTHTHTNTHAYSPTHTGAHAHVHTHKRTNTYTCAQKLAHLCAHTCALTTTCSRVHPPTHPHAHNHTCPNAKMYKRTPTCHTHTHTHTRAHTVRASKHTLARCSPRKANTTSSSYRGTMIDQLPILSREGGLSRPGLARLRSRRAHIASERMHRHTHTKLRAACLGPGWPGCKAGAFGTLLISTNGPIAPATRSWMGGSTKCIQHVVSTEIRLWGSGMRGICIFASIGHMLSQLISSCTVPAAPRQSR